MADAFGIIGTIAVAGSALAKCYRYGCAVKDSPREASSLAQSLKDLSGALAALNSIENEIHNSASKDAVQRILTDTRVQLESLQKRLSLKAPTNNESTFRAGIQRFKWPFSRAETLSMMDSIERQKSTIESHLATLSIANLSITQAKIDKLTQLSEQEAIVRQKGTIDAHLQQLLSWLSKYDHDIKLSRVLSQMHPGTGQWIFSTAQWSSWIQNGNSLLWVYGKSGSGKTVLAANMIRHLLQQTSSSPFCVLHFFCDSNDATTQALAALLRAILRQLCAACDSIPKPMEDEFQRCKATGGLERDLSTSELQLLLQQCLCDSVVGAVAIVVDAVNEAEIPQEVIEFLGRMGQLTQCDTRVILTSISEPRDSHGKFEGLTLPILGQEHSSDIEAFLVDRIPSIPKLKLLTDKQRQTLVSALNQNSDGSFLWVHCHLVQLSKFRSIGEIVQGIKNLPSDIEDLYNQRISRLSPNGDRSRVQVALLFLLVAPYSMAVAELAEVTTLRVEELFEPKMSLFFDPEMRLLDTNDILDISAPFAWLVPGTGRMSLAHHSVRTFLLQRRAKDEAFKFDLPTAHFLVARACLTYLSDVLADAAEHIPNVSHYRWFRLVDTYPLLRYSALFWPLHVFLSGRERELLSQTQTFLSLQSGRFHQWLALLRTTTTSDYYIPGRWAPNDTPLYHAVSHGLIENARALITNGADVNEIGGSRGGTPLHAACFRCRPRIAQLLLESGADPEAKETFEHQYTAFETAVWAEDQDTVFVFARLGKIPITCTHLAVDIATTSMASRGGIVDTEEGPVLIFWACCLCRCSNSYVALACKRCKAARCNRCGLHGIYGYARVIRKSSDRYSVSKSTLRSLHTIQSGLDTPPP